jgi:hypothetical protein
MARRILGPRQGGVTLQINSVGYSNTATSMRFRSTVAQDDVTVFGDEPDSKYEQGETVNVFQFASIMTDGHAAAAPPYPPPQNATVVMAWGGTVNAQTFVGNFTDLDLARDVKRTGVISGAGRVVGAVVQAWVTT